MKKRADTGKYAAFGVNDFICDDYFQYWVMRPGSEEDAFWQSWIQEHPGKQEVIEQARQMLSKIAFREHWPSNEQIQQSLAQHLARVDNDEEGYMARRSARVRRMRRLLVAASLTGIAVLAGSIFFYRAQRQPVHYATAYGNTHTIYLPDSSLVVLNAHSDLHYTPWKANSPREVWLEGEAFFNVRHIATKPDTGEETAAGADGIKPYERFLVQTSELMVEVLGTSFDIRQRRGKTEIVLQEGKIRVSFKKTQQPPVIMKPGDLLSYDPMAARVTRAATVASDYTAWVSGKLMLPDPNMQQIAQYLEDNYGYKVVLKDPALAKKSVEGPILFDNLDDVLFVLSKVLDVDIVKKDSTLIFSPR